MFLDWKNQYHETDYTTQSRFNAIPTKLPTVYLSQNQNKKFHNLYGNTKDPKKPKQQLEDSTFLTLDYPTKLQSSRQYDTGTETEIQANGTKWKAQR